MPPKKSDGNKQRKTKIISPKMESLKAVTALEKEIDKLKTKHEKTHTQWLTKLKKQIEKGADQIKKMKARVAKAKTISTRKTIAMNLKAIHQKQGELKAELKELSKQYKKFVAQEKCLKRFEKDYHKIEAQKTNVRSKKKSTLKKNVEPTNIDVDTHDTSKKEG